MIIANLNLDPLFADRVPTTENLCRAVFGLLKDALPAGELEHVRVEETENNFFECYGAGSEEADSSRTIGADTQDRIEALDSPG